jgi:hypothetical protein
LLKLRKIPDLEIFWKVLVNNYHPGEPPHIVKKKTHPPRPRVHLVEKRIIFRNSGIFPEKFNKNSTILKNSGS